MSKHEKDNIKVFPSKEHEENNTEEEIKEEQQEVNNEPEQETKDLATEYLNLAKQVQADFDNFRKRTIEDIKKARIDGLVDAVKVILPAIDVFDVALKQITDEKAIEGINMVKAQIEKSLTELGITKIECVGKPFNPHLHNAVLTQNSEDYEDEIVTDEYASGYMYKDKVIRYSQVRVNKR